MRRLLLAVFLAAPPLAGAASNQGQAGAQFLKLGSSARAGGMGDAFTALSDDAYAVHYNPAGLTKLTSAQIGGGHTSLFQRITFQSLALAIPYGKKDDYSRNVLGLGVLYLGVGDIERRTSDSTDPVGTFTASDSAYSVSFAHAFNERTSFGVSGKHISQAIDSYRGNSTAVDFGLLHRVAEEKDSVTLGLAVKHLGKRIGYVDSQRDPLPAAVSLGAAKQVAKPLLVSLEAGKAADADPYGAIGLEGRKQFFEDGLGACLRFGYNSSRRELGAVSGVSAGAGLVFPKGRLDLAWVPFGPLGDSFRFTLLVKF